MRLSIMSHITKPQTQGQSIWKNLMEWGSGAIESHPRPVGHPGEYESSNSNSIPMAQTSSVCFHPRERAAFQDARKLLRLVYYKSIRKRRELLKAEHLLTQFFQNDIKRQNMYADQ